MNTDTKPRSSLPGFVEHGVLPSGIHEASLVELAQRFGTFKKTERRVKLMASLSDYIEELHQSDAVVGVIVDGSFVTNKEEPNDIDVIVLVRADHDFASELSPADYNLLSSKRARKRHGIDVMVAAEQSDAAKLLIEFFQQVREVPGVEKGLVRVQPWL